MPVKRFMVGAIVALSVLALSIGSSSAQPGRGQGGGNGGGGNDGGSTDTYRIIDLVGPYHEANGGFSQTQADSISDPTSDGTHYLVGEFGTDREICRWTVFADDSYLVEDVTAAVQAELGANQFVDFADVNNHGILGGRQYELLSTEPARPILVLKDLSVVELSTEAGGVAALNNPGTDGTFQVVGYLGAINRPVSVLWDVRVDGTILATTLLQDSLGQPFLADDIRQDGLMAGRLIELDSFTGLPVRSVPGTATLDLSGVVNFIPLSIPSPEEINFVERLQVDRAGNVLGDGTDFQSRARAVIWPTAGAPIDLSVQFGLASSVGNGIAFVNGEMQVVGRAIFPDGSGSFFNAAFLLRRGSLIELGSLLQIAKGDAPWRIDSAEAISSSGAICGYGLVGKRKQEQNHGFMMVK